MEKYKKKATPLQNGWRYFAINLDLIDHADVRSKMDILVDLTGLTKKRLLKEMIEDRLDKETIGGKHEKGINSINSI